jgi:FkbM family methyltransferase
MSRDFVCPMDCLPGVVEAMGGQYPLHLFQLLNPKPVILDIGANVGAFSVACLQRWPGAEVYAYEPHPELYCYLVGNTGPLGVKCRRTAVGDAKLQLPLRAGNENRLTCSQYDLGRQSEEAIQVEVVHAGTLPKADLVKIDTEGAEVAIVRGLLEDNKLPSGAMIVEWHKESLRREIEAMLRFTPMGLFFSQVLGHGWGVSAWARQLEVQQ